MISSENTESLSSFQFQVNTPQPVRTERIFNDYGEELFTAGQLVPAGTYLDVESGRQVTLELPGMLPASLNGRRAFYSRLERPWIKAQIPRSSVVNSRN
jgi:hypothetical protein